MAVKPTKLRPLHDENIGNVASFLPATGKPIAPNASVKTGGLKPKERKILRDISNKLQPHSSKPPAGTPAGQGVLTSKTFGDNVAPKTCFSVLPDANLAASKPPQEAPSARPIDPMPPKVASTARIPLRNISNSNTLPQDLEKTLETRNSKKQASQSGTEIEEKKIRAWAEEGIERIHFSGQDMEALREKIQKEEMEKRIAQVLSCRTELPLLHRCPSLESGFLDVPKKLDLEPVQDLEDEECPLWIFRGDADVDMSVLEESYLDTFANTMLDSFSETWPHVAEDDVREVA